VSDPLVSVLIPAYNAEKWIGQTIRSALEQTWKRKEIIIVDDGSTDKTAIVARCFAAKNVLVVRQGNEGAPAARNRALSLCQGDVMQWLDADDLLSPDKIERQMALIDLSAKQQPLVSSEWAYFFYRPRKAMFRPTALWEDLSPLEWLVRKLERNLHMQTATWLVGRALSDAAGPWDTRLISDDDGEYFCRVLLASSGVRFASGARVYYRASGSGSWGTLGGSRRKLEAHWLSMRMHIGYVRSLEDSERVRSACREYLQNWLPYFYPEHRDLVGEFEILARDLGGELRPPKVPWKYAWIKKWCGWPLAKRAWVGLPRVRASLARSVDRILYSLEGDFGPRLG
jgi:glycosyltransferase involved in cell wall biosynthesis